MKDFCDRLHRIPRLLVITMLAACQTAPVPDFDNSTTVENLRLESDTAGIRAPDGIIPFTELTQYVAGRLSKVDRWILTLPDNVPIDHAINVFGYFEAAGCENVSVYSSRPAGDWADRELGIGLSETGPVQIIALYLQKDPQAIEKLKEANYRYALYAPMVPMDELTAATGPLISLLQEKHVRIHENGGLLGMPAGRYVDAMELLRESGAEKVSFFGIYLE